jgi:uncharacterized protein
MNAISLPFEAALLAALEQSPAYIQVVLGPRQVGKTTGIHQVLHKRARHDAYYVSADGDLTQPAHWLFEQWELAKAQSPDGILVVDEIQKVENWSAALKQLWDGQKRNATQLRVVVLGSSSLSLQRGLSESLAGRFQLHKVYHWNPMESHDGYSLSLEDFLVFGGYPGSYAFIRQKTEWLAYIKESIVAPVIGKDILSQARVKSPALFKQCFDLACSYPAQEISYTKLLGQLQDKGNTNLVKYYLQLFEEAFLIKQLFKYTTKKVVTKSSSPKILPLCPALFTVGLDADINVEERGRCFEVTVGALLNRLPGKLHYWRDKNAEVDFVYSYGKQLHAIEVKSGKNTHAKGLMKFTEQFPHCQTYIATPDNYHETLQTIASTHSAKTA